jgi:hypothetical protein
MVHSIQLQCPQRPQSRRVGNLSILALSRGEEVGPGAGAETVIVVTDRVMGHALAIRVQEISQDIVIVIGIETGTEVRRERKIEGVRGVDLVPVRVKGEADRGVISVLVQEWDRGDGGKMSGIERQRDVAEGEV